MAFYGHDTYTLQLELFWTLPAPTVTDVDPGNGPEVGGTAVTLTGLGYLNQSAGANTVTFDGVAATSVVTVSDTTITCVTPAGTGVVDVVVTNNFGSGTLSSGYTYDAPVLTTPLTRTFAPVRMVQSSAELSLAPVRASLLDTLALAPVTLGTVLAPVRLETLDARIEEEGD